MAQEKDKPLFTTEYYREQQRKRSYSMRMIKDLTMAVVILGMSLLMLLGDKFSFSSRVVYSIDPFMRYFFGALCLIYGAFRAYRAVKQDN